MVGCVTAPPSATPANPTGSRRHAGHHPAGRRHRGERAASTIIEWSPSIIPGLLQEADHARAILSHNGRNTADLEPRLLVRIGRREVITRGNPTRLTALIGEEALRDPVIAPALMADQLMHLVRMSERPNVQLWTVPARIGWHPGSCVEVAHTRDLVRDSKNPSVILHVDVRALLAAAKNSRQS